MKNHMKTLLLAFALLLTSTPLWSEEMNYAEPQVPRGLSPDMIDQSFAPPSAEATAEEPSSAPSTPPPAATANDAVAKGPRPAEHEVAAGDTLYNISRRYGLTVSALQKANGNVSPQALRLGQKLRLPAGE